MGKSKPAVITGIRIAGVLGAGALIVVMNKFFQSPDDDFENWLKKTRMKNLMMGMKNEDLNG